MPTREQQIEIFIGNDLGIDDDGWALIAPFGEWPKSRIAKINGRPTLQKFIQVLDNASADALLNKENGFFRRLKRALVGIPIYGNKDGAHPDLNDVAPETLSNAKGPKNVIGVVDQVRKGIKGIEAHFALTPEGAAAVENDGLKYPSALWVGDGNARADGVIIFRPSTLVSIGLTATPNISGVDSLANARPADQPQTVTEPDMKKITGWLLAKGAAIGNSDDATESQVLEAFQKLLDAQTGRVTTLGNEKDTLAGKLSGLETDKTTLSGKITALENERTTLSGQVAALGNSVKAERKAAAAAVVDLAIHKGKITVAERDAQITALENAADAAAFKTAADALLAKAGKVIKLPADAQGTKALANDGTTESASPRDEYCAALNDHMKANPGDSAIKAHNAVMKKFPSIKEKMTQGTGASQ